MASLNLIIVLILIAEVALGCQEDSAIRCALSRRPPLPAALIHCETDVPDIRLHANAII